MKIVIVGGSRGTGALLAEKALADGHEVAIVSRGGSNSADARVTQYTGDATEAEFITQAITGADAVVVTVGGSKGSKLARTQVTQSVAAAMQSSGAKRLVVQSSLGAGDSTVQLPGFIGGVTKLLLRQPLIDHSAQEAVVRESGLDWTIARPTGLSNGSGTGTWKALEVGDAGRLGGMITRHDVAAFMLQALSDDTTIRRAYGLSAS